ncbi:hypothetical protein MUP59_04265 [Candidatus Bathyarchaeota archaeon]|nr:hypothetical protein [Candidatus Bathyarchaeota archaeon]
MKKKQEKKQEELSKSQMLDSQLGDLESELLVLEDEAQELDECGPNIDAISDLKGEIKELSKMMKLYNIDCTALVQAGKIYVEESKAIDRKIDTVLKDNMKKQGVLKKKMIKIEDQIKKENEKEVERRTKVMF